MEKRNLITIVAIVVVVALVFSIYKFTGLPVTSEGGDVGVCQESDEGDDPYTKGSCTYSNRDTVYTDECYAASASGEEEWLREYVCMDKIMTVRYFCVEGCEDGACLEGEVHLLD